VITDPLVLEGETVRLEPLLPAHAAALVAAANDGELWRSTVTIVPSAATIDAYLATAFKAKAAGQQYPFVTILRATGAVIGTTRYLAIEPAHRKLEIGSTWLGASHQRTSANTEAKYLMMRHAFEVLHAVRMQFMTHALNTQSRRAIERLGAKAEGILRNHMIMPDGRYRDSACYSIVEAEWPEVKRFLEERLAR
jgi:RimJ/RimL family protein N-acetyltransferase